MFAWAVERPGPIDSEPLKALDGPPPEPGPGELRAIVSCCGVCRTDLHLAEGDLKPRRPLAVPGHEVVGRVDALGEGCGRFAVGDRVGVAWLASTCGSCRFCKAGRENLCVTARFTGWDRDGGYAEQVVVHEQYAYALPESFDDEKAAPLLCAGIIGYRALRQSELPPGGRLALYGFGGSAHLALQVAVSEGAGVHVFTRSERARKLALSLGARWAGSPEDAPGERFDSAVIFAPAGELVPVALRALDLGGTVAIAGIHLSEIPSLDYAEHLFGERRLHSVTANTRQDGEEFLETAARINISVTTTPYDLGDAPRALRDLKGGRVSGAAVLMAKGHS